MAPELHAKEEKPYDGTAVDIFALGQVLYTMRFANHAFWRSDDNHYKMLMSNPKATMEARKLECEPELLDLLVGMLQQDPEKRYKMTQIKEHPYLKGEIATKEQVIEHHNLLKGCKVYKGGDRAAYAGVGKKPQRGHDEVAEKSPSEEDLLSWEELEYKPFDTENFEYMPMTGFQTDTLGVFIFSAIWEHLSVCKVTPNVSSKKWKMNFSIDYGLPCIENDSDTLKERVDC